MFYKPTIAHERSSAFETRFLLACQSNEFEPTIIFAAKSHLALSSLYRGLPIKKHCLGLCDTGQSVIELVNATKPNILMLSNDLEDMRCEEILSAAKSNLPRLRSIVFYDEACNYKGKISSQVIIAQDDILHEEDTFMQAGMAIASNTEYYSQSILKRHKDLCLAKPNQPAGVISLTPREHQILQAYALGLSNRETAARLGLSIRSVQTYSGNLLQKLGTSNRQKALLFAVKQGLTKIRDIF